MADATGAPEAPPKDTKAVTQSELNLVMYERVFKESIESARRILQEGDGSFTPEVRALATTLFDRYFDDQIKLGDDKRRMATLAPFLKGLVAALERRGLHL